MPKEEAWKNMLEWNSSFLTIDVCDQGWIFVNSHGIHANSMKFNPQKTISQSKAKNHGFQSCDWGQVKNHKLTQLDFLWLTHFSGGETGGLITSPQVSTRNICYNFATKENYVSCINICPFSISCPTIDFNQFIFHATES